MALASGSRIGPYEISGLIGAGGMGEVYRAQDAKLGRDVAIKVLPPVFAQDPDRRARFEREARVLASLNHPYIAVVYGLEDAPADAAGSVSSALVMELVEGPTLAERLAQSPLGVAEALGIAKQVAEALEAAHECGIIHRDLKPANIKLRRDGAVKVLDFGLAKALVRDAASGNFVDSPTFVAGASHQGVILGTAGYMAPEQARGGTVDRSVDLWAFGCVLFEMLTGKPAFEGEDATDVVAAVIKTEPDWNRLPVETPQQVRTLLKHCLCKQPRQRLGDARAARFALEDALAEPWYSAGTNVAPAPGHRRLATWKVGAAAAVLAAAAGALVTRATMSVPVAERVVTRALLGTEPAESISFGVASARPAYAALAISPDGRTIVFNGLRRDDRGLASWQLYRRRLDAAAATPMQGTELGIDPAFSPDGRWIAFYTTDTRQLKKVSVDGGPAVVIAQLSSGDTWNGLSWATADTIVFAPGDGIFRVSPDGGDPEPIVAPLTGQPGGGHFVPQMLPGGQWLLYTTRTVGGERTDTHIVARRLDTGEELTLLQSAADARYLESGHLLYLRRGTLLAAPFDVEGLMFTGPAVALLDDVMQAIGAYNTRDETYRGQFQLAANGTLVYLSGGTYPRLRAELVWVDREGVEQPLHATEDQATGVRISPDGTRIAMMRTQGFDERDLWVYDIERQSATRLTFGGTNAWPNWSPDSREIAFARSAAGVNELFRLRLDDSDGVRPLGSNQLRGAPASWSRAGNVLAYRTGIAGTRWQIWTLPMDGDSQPSLFLESPFDLQYPEFSPDGRWLAYTSNETGADEVYVQPYPGPGARIRVSPDGGTAPTWSPDGRELFYLRASAVPGTQQLQSVEVDTADGLRAGRPRLLFEHQYNATTPLRNYDVAGDGRHFVMTKTAGWPTPVTEIHVVLNWLAELEPRVAVNR